MVYTMHISGLSARRGVEAGDGEPTGMRQGAWEASSVSGRPKFERSRVEEADMDETTYSTLLPFNSTVLSASVPPPPPPPPPSVPSTSSIVRVAPRFEPAPQDTSTASQSFCTAIMDSHSRITNRSAPQTGRHRIKQGLIFLNTFILRRVLSTVVYICN